MVPVVVAVGCLERGIALYSKCDCLTTVEWYGRMTGQHVRKIKWTLTLPTNHLFIAKTRPLVLHAAALPPHRPPTYTNPKLWKLIPPTTPPLYSHSPPPIYKPVKTSNLIINPAHNALSSRAPR